MATGFWVQGSAVQLSGHVLWTQVALTKRSSPTVSVQKSNGEGRPCLKSRGNARRGALRPAKDDLTGPTLSPDCRSWPAGSDLLEPRILSPYTRPAS